MWRNFGEEADLAVDETKSPFLKATNTPVESLDDSEEFHFHNAWILFNSIVFRWLAKCSLVALSLITTYVT